MTTRVSILIPTRNRAALLGIAIRSALAQGQQDIEIVVSDNWSTDETEHCVASFCDSRLRYRRSSAPLPMRDHWNECLREATGQYCVVLSDDDVLLPGAIEALSLALDAPDYELAYCAYTTIDEAGDALSTSTPGPLSETGLQFIRAQLQRQRAVMPSGLMFRTASLRRHGGFPDAGTATDLAARLLLATEGRAVCEPTPLLLYRQHSSNLSKEGAKVLESHLKLEAWATGSAAMQTFMPLIRGLVERTIIHYGLHCAVSADRAGWCTAYGLLGARDQRLARRMFGMAILWAGRLGPVGPAYWLLKYLRGRRKRSQLPVELID